MSTLADRITECRVTDLKLNKKKFAEMVGVSGPTVTDWENGVITHIKAKNLLKISTAAKISPTWLESGMGKKYQTAWMTSAAKVGEIHPGPYASTHNVTPGPDTKGHVPVISWIQAGHWSEAIDNYQPGEADEFIPCPANHGMHTYALRVEGDSMTSSHGKSYPDGCYIYVDPDQRGGITNGDRVVAKISGDNKVTFKQYIDDGGKQFLRPLNPQFPVITDEFRVLGKVIGTWIPE